MWDFSDKHRFPYVVKSIRGFNIDSHSALRDAGFPPASKSHLFVFSIQLLLFLFALQRGFFDGECLKKRKEKRKS